MIKEKVRPSGAGREALWLILAVAVVLAVSGTMIHVRTRTEDTRNLGPNRISAFDDLNANEQGTFNDLFAAGDFIEEEHEFGGHQAWPDPEELSDEALSPFVEDRAWKARGKLKWTRRTLETIEPGEGVEQVAAYLGVPAEEGLSGAFMLVVRHHHEQADSAKRKVHERSCRIWYRESDGAAFPERLSVSALVSAGWREVVALSGKDEVRRLRGGQ